MNDTSNRRPLASRGTAWAKATARWLSGTAVTPNQLSMGSIVFAAVAGVCFYFAGQLLIGAAGTSQLLLNTSGTGQALSDASGSGDNSVQSSTSVISVVVLLLLAGLSCQARLLCNLFDGMLAIEANKQTPDGAAWNEFPDRFADICIFVGLGYGINEPALGWAASCFCVLTAYVRELRNATAVSTAESTALSTAVSANVKADFCGPMAKQHRIAVVTLMVVLLIGLLLVKPFDDVRSTGILIWKGTLWLVTVGAVITVFRRIKRLLDSLNNS